VESSRRSRVLAGAVAPGEEPTQEQVQPDGLQPAVKTHAGAGENCEEEEVADRHCYGQTTTPIPHPPALRGGEVG